MSCSSQSILFPFFLKIFKQQTQTAQTRYARIDLRAYEIPRYYVQHTPKQKLLVTPLPGKNFHRRSYIIPPAGTVDTHFACRSFFSFIPDATITVNRLRSSYVRIPDDVGRSSQKWKQTHKRFRIRIEALSTYASSEVPDIRAHVYNTGRYR